MIFFQTESFVLLLFSVRVSFQSELHFPYQKGLGEDHPVFPIINFAHWRTWTPKSGDYYGKINCTQRHGRIYTGNRGATHSFEISSCLILLNSGEIWIGARIRNYMYSFYVLYYSPVEGVGRRLSALNVKLTKLILQTGCPNLMEEISPNLEALNLNPFISMKYLKR